MKSYFEIKVNKYVPGLNYSVYRSASLDYPKDNAVMFVTDGFVNSAKALLKVNNCLVFWPANVEVPEYIQNNHAIVICENPHVQYSKFYRENNITYLPPLDEFEVVNGAYIAKTAIIGRNARIFPGVYIGGEVVIGNNVFIGSGTKIVGEVKIGDDVVIRENSVIGADGLSTDRDENGKAVTMPQFGGVILEDRVEIGANTVIARAAIDYTIIHEGCKIDNSCFISHNVQIGADTFIVGETIMFGSSSTGERVQISGNSTIRNGVHIGNNSFVGMGSVVTNAVPDNTVVLGNPARSRK